MKPTPFIGNGHYLFFERTLKMLLQVNEFAAFESHGFKKREHVGRIPTRGGVYPADAQTFIDFKNLAGQLIADPLAHEFRIHTQCRNPSAFFDAKTKRKDIADDKTDDATVQLGHIADIAIALGMIFNQGFNIDAHRLANYGCIDVDDGLRIGGFKSSDPKIFHVNNPLITRA